MGSVHKLIDLVGTSEVSVDDAIRSAVGEAHKSLRGLEWFEVSEIRGGIHEGKVNKFQVVLKVGFKLESH